MSSIIKPKKFIDKNVFSLVKKSSSLHLIKPYNNSNSNNNNNNINNNNNNNNNNTKNDNIKNNIEDFAKLYINNAGPNHVSLDIHIRDEEVHDLIHSLMQIQLLTKLELSLPNITNQGIQVISHYIASSNCLASLVLRINGVNSRGAEHMGAALSDNACLTYLEIDCIQCDMLDYVIGTEGAAAISSSLSSNKISNLALKQCGINEVQFDTFLSFLSKSHLTCLDLTGNSLGDACLTFLNEELPVLTNLTTLILDSNQQSGHLGINSLFNSLTINNNYIEYLSLKSCQLSSQSLPLLGNLLLKNFTLKRLNLSANRNLSEAIEMLSRGLEKNTNLEILDISHCSLTETNVVKILSTLRTNINLRELYIGHNEIHTGAIHEIGQSLICNNSLEMLSIPGCIITESNMFTLMECLNKNTTLKQLQIETPHYRNAELYNAFLDTLLEKNRIINRLNQKLNTNV